MEIEIKKIGNGWLITITGNTVEIRNENVLPIEHFEPTLEEAFAFIKKITGQK